MRTGALILTNHFFFTSFILFSSHISSVDVSVSSDVFNEVLEKCGIVCDQPLFPQGKAGQINAWSLISIQYEQDPLPMRRPTRPPKKGTGRKKVRRPLKANAEWRRAEIGQG